MRRQAGKGIGGHLGGLAGLPRAIHPVLGPKEALEADAFLQQGHRRGSQVAGHPCRMAQKSNAPCFSQKAGFIEQPLEARRARAMRSR